MSGKTITLEELQKNPFPYDWPGVGRILNQLCACGHLMTEHRNTYTFGHGGCKPEHRRPTDVTDIEEFWSQARSAWTSHVERARGAALVLELQPGDGTRYVCALAHSIDADDDPGVIFAAWIPRMLACELAEGDLCPDVFDTPFCGINDYTAAIFVDVLRAVVFGVAERRYSYAHGCPVSMLQAPAGGAENGAGGA